MDQEKYAETVERLNSLAISAARDISSQYPRREY